jgi:ubiquinone/menaquinone biosynthesis C-methylase UbiE
MKKKKRPVAQDAYDRLAEAYAAIVETKPHNAYYERPATLSMLPDVEGLRVLDAGCGPGVYADWLLNHGAEVVAVDGNERMVGLARERLQDRCEIILANLEAPLSFVQESMFDAVLSSLVMDYIRDWRAVFGEFHRVLKPGGCFVFSIEHPYHKYDIHRDSSAYFDVDLVEYEWRGFGMPVRVPSYRRPMSEVINPLIEVGFAVDRILEPVPTAAFYREAPEDYDELTRRPGFLCIRAVRFDSGA